MRPCPIGLVSWLLFAALSCSLSVAAMPRSALPADSVIVQPGQLPPEIHDQARQLLLQLKSATDDGRRPREIRGVGDGSDALAFEFALARWVDELQAGADSKVARETLRELTTQSPRVYMRHQETAGDWYLPLVDPAARARSALKMLDARAARVRWQQRLVADPTAALEALKLAPDVERIQAAEAIADIRDTAPLHQAMLAQPTVDSRLWAALAVRSADPSVYFAAAAHARDTELLHLIPHAVAQMAVADASDWLIGLADREALASAALLALADFASTDERARAFLVNALDHPRHADSAASGLSRLPEVELRAVCLQLIDDPDASARRLMSVALALRLAGPSAPAALLQRLQQDPRLPMTVRRELQR